jgi:hypothetical protein
MACEVGLVLPPPIHYLCLRLKTGFLILGLLVLGFLDWMGHDLLLCHSMIILAMMPRASSRQLALLSLSQEPF